MLATNVSTGSHPPMGLDHPNSAVHGRNAAEIERTISDLYETESRRVFATLIRLLGDFDLAEDALHDAFTAALRQWPQDGIPANPRAWLVSTGRFKAIDGIRRRARFNASLATLAADLDIQAMDVGGERRRRPG